jgi:tRNA(fMet)-specific endonuclease VapC
MRLALDTNIYGEVCRGEEEAVARVARAETVFLPFVVLGELRAGFSLGARARENERILQRFLAKPSVDILFPTDATTIHYASLFRQLREQGTPVPTNDLWIAALVIEHRLTLYSHDRHFEHIPQLDRWV